MDIEKVIKWLKAISAMQNQSIDKYSLVERKESLDIAIKAVKKQLPMEVKEIHVDEYFCPACGSENNCNDRIVEHKYCPECGQRLIS